MTYERCALGSHKESMNIASKKAGARLEEGQYVSTLQMISP